MDFLFFFHSWTPLIITLASGLTLLGSSFYFWTNSAKVRRVEEDSTEDKIKKLFKEQLELQNQKIEILTKEVEGYRKEIAGLKEMQAKLSSENQGYLDIFRGRDTDAVEYRKEGRESMKQIRENGRMLVKILEHMDKQYSLLKTYFNVTDKEVLQK